MYCDCHIHMVLDGQDWKAAIAAHREAPNDAIIRMNLRRWQAAGMTYLREGGDRWGVGARARELAPEYGIRLVTPLSPLYKAGHYGSFIGTQFETLRDYARLVAQQRKTGADFIKIMISGIMEYEEFGALSEPGLDADWIKEMIHIAHEEGFAVMVHGNGRDAVMTAVEAGADSIEHGNYIDTDCLDAMSERNCVWVPTIVTTKNLLGCGRYPEKVLEQIYEKEQENLVYGYQKGVQMAAGSDAGAYLVPHGKGVLQEIEIFIETLTNLGYNETDVRERIRQGECQIRNCFSRK